MVVEGGQWCVGQWCVGQWCWLEWVYLQVGLLAKKGLFNISQQNDVQCLQNIEWNKAGHHIPFTEVLIDIIHIKPFFPKSFYNTNLSYQIKSRMYLECLLIARNKSQADQEVSNIMNTHAINTWSQLNINKQYRSTVRLNNKYLDSHQNQQSRNNNHRTAANLQPYKFHTVLVSPLRADLETCFDLFGENTNVQIYVDPALAPRVNSMAAASQDNSHLIKQFFVKPNLTKLEQNTHWFLTFGQKGRMGDESVQQFQKYLQNQSQFQSQAHFHQRIADCKKQLFVYSNQKNEKTGIIAHPQVLQVLSSTGLHQSFCLINSVKVDFGQSRSEFILIEGIQGEKQSTSLPFCQMLC